MCVSTDPKVLQHLRTMELSSLLAASIKTKASSPDAKPLYVTVSGKDVTSASNRDGIAPVRRCVRLRVC